MFFFFSLESFVVALFWNLSKCWEGTNQPNSETKTSKKTIFPKKKWRKPNYSILFLWYHFFPFPSPLRTRQQDLEVLYPKADQMNGMKKNKERKIWSEHCLEFQFLCSSFIYTYGVFVFLIPHQSLQLSCSMIPQLMESSRILCLILNKKNCYCQTATQ